MSFSFESGVGGIRDLRTQCGQLRQEVHEKMKAEEQHRLETNPVPTDEELRMGVFRESLEPQVRNAVEEMFRKGYATQSSGFQGKKFEEQSIDGWFTIDSETKNKLAGLGVEVLRGADIGLPQNKIVTILRFRTRRASVEDMKATWGQVAALLPNKILPPGIRPISDRVEEFRQKYAPHQPSLEREREAYIAYIRSANE